MCILAAEEVVADGMELILTDGKVLEELAHTDKSLWEKIKSWISNIVSKIKKYYGELNQASKTAQVLKETMDSLDEIKRMFTEGAKEAGERARAAETNTRATENGRNVYAFKGYAEDGKKIYESNFPKGTPKAAKSERILNYIQNVWSKKPIPLVISNGETSRTIYAQFDPTIDKTKTEPSDASKLAGGNRHGNHTEQRVTLDLADDYYDIASSATYNYSKMETGKDSIPHDGVIMWHYFVEDIYFSEFGNDEKTPYTVTINVKEKANGEYVYSFNAEKESPTRQTLHADVSTRKGTNGELFLDDSIPQYEESVNTFDENSSDNLYSIDETAENADVIENERLKAENKKLEERVQRMRYRQFRKAVESGELEAKAHKQELSDGATTVLESIGIGDGRNHTELTRRMSELYARMAGEKKISYGEAFDEAAKISDWLLGIQHDIRYSMDEAMAKKNGTVNENH